MTTYKNLNLKLPWSGWKNDKPHFHERTLMKEACGKKCFLGKNKSFPICTKGTCDINNKGVWAAYMRSREFGSKNKRSRKYSRNYYKKIANRSRKILKKKGYDVGKTLKLRRQRRTSGGNDGKNNNNNVVVEEGAGINNFFRNIGINQPSQPDETLFW